MTPRAGTTSIARLVLALAAVDLVLFTFALRLGEGEVRDGAGSVTTGHNVALSIAATLVVALGLVLLRLPARLRGQAQAFALLGQGLHAAGHLARWYYTIRWYDDALHVLLTFGAAILALRLAQASDVFPEKHATPLRAALVALVVALALAGIWELFEFTMDNVQSSREQDDLADTMRDMVDGAIGGILAAAWAAMRPRSFAPPGGRRAHGPS